MAAGLFELRKDAITGWWVATIVDRTFHRDRFRVAAAAVDDGGDCQNCREPAGDGVRTRTLKDFAFHVVGTEEEARQLDRDLAQVAIEKARAAGSWRTVVAPPREHRPLQAVGGAIVSEMLRACRDAIADARKAGYHGDRFGHAFRADLPRDVVSRDADPGDAFGGDSAGSFRQPRLVGASQARHRVLIRDVHVPLEREPCDRAIEGTRVQEPHLQPCGKEPGYGAFSAAGGSIDCDDHSVTIIPALPHVSRRPDCRAGTSQAPRRSRVF